MLVRALAGIALFIVLSMSPDQEAVPTVQEIEQPQEEAFTGLEVQEELAVELETDEGFVIY